MSSLPLFEKHHGTGPPEWSKAASIRARGFVRSMERGGRFKATCPGYASRFVVGRPLLLRGLKQTGRSEIAGWSSFIGSERPHLESWEVRLANYTVDRVKGSR